MGNNYFNEGIQFPGLESDGTLTYWFDGIPYGYLLSSGTTPEPPPVTVTYRVKTSPAFGSANVMII